MEFEFDPNKSHTNLHKHGIDFIEAQDLWLDPDCLLIPAKLVGDEPRWAILARRQDQCWTGIYALRNGNVRIISVRRAHPEEERFYHGQKTDR